MIYLDHDGHEIRRDPEPTGEPFDVRFHAQRGGIRYGDQPAGGYWDRLREDMRQARVVRCPIHGTPMMHSLLYGDNCCQDINCKWAHGGYQ